ncbi:MAG: helix-turn-helix domain-containing protein [Chloroflexota bacterium]
MPITFTIAHLLSPAGPLAGGDLLAGERGLDNAVTWAVSLRPYAPAIPRLKGGEIALVGMDLLSRHEPPVTLADVVRELQARGASGMAVRGDVDSAAVEAADSAGLPLIRIAGDTPLHEIEQAIMRECALFLARREIMAEEAPGAWIERLLTGEIATFTDAQVLARREGHVLAPHYEVAYVVPRNRTGPHGRLYEIVERIAALNRKREQGILHFAQETNLTVLLPTGAEGDVLAAIHEGGWACGVGGQRPTLQAGESLREAKLAAQSSALLHDGAPVRYADLGADKMLLLLYRDNRAELEAFVEETLGPLLRHDSHSATPLLPTVASFVGHSGRLRETAAEIYVHRNTLAYRLDRAAEILGVDLKEADARLALEMALRSLKLVRSNYVL